MNTSQYFLQFTSQSRSIDVIPEEITRLRDWYQQLPKVLWEAGANDPNLAEVRIIRRKQFFHI